MEKIWYTKFYERRSSDGDTTSENNAATHSAERISKATDANGALGFAIVSRQEDERVDGHPHNVNHVKDFQNLEENYLLIEQITSR